MFALHERHKRQAAQHAISVLRQRLEALVKVTAAAIDQLWEASPSAYASKLAELEADVGALADPALPPAPFEPTSPMRYRPVPGEHAMRQEAERNVDSLRRALFQLQQVALKVPHWVAAQQGKPNAPATREVLKAHVRSEITQILRPLQQRPLQVEDVLSKQASPAHHRG